MVRFGEFSFNVERGELREADAVVRLTDKEREMLQIARRRRRARFRATLSPAPGLPSNERTIDVQINRLRRKIERDPSNPVHLQTVRGLGYRLVLDP